MSIVFMFFDRPLAKETVLTVSWQSLVLVFTSDKIFPIKKSIN